MMNKSQILQYLIQLTKPSMTDQQIADKLGIHVVSWRRIKSGRAPVSDKLLVRINNLFPQLGIFLPEKATKSSKSKI